MPTTSPISRRKFLQLASLTAATLALEACSPAEPLPTPTATPIPLPTDTPTPEAPSVALPEMVRVKAGSFEMGASDQSADAQPVHAVTISQDFFIGKYPVTFAEFDVFCADTARGKPQDDGWGRDNRPVIYTDWNDAVAYCNWLSQQEGLSPCYSGGGKATRCDFTADGYRLPTEAEWEFAARGGLESKGYRFAGSDTIEDVAWIVDNANGQTQPVGLKQPNELGLFDMSGNVWEWCGDKYAEDYYAASPEVDPPGPKKGLENKYLGGWERVRRGGAFNEGADSCRITYRSYDGQAYKAFASGFRVVKLAQGGNS